ncbi:MAG: Protein-L-isoaspartate O-methyltransferase [Alphaproteobacteria bacterium MarineAlpha4_Bin2]|nr:MAG: Protein-L-isoaspartate O-methyltransferase [Alphaproteobacteria bacterium MarineAlpha4_Bin2]
MTPATRKIRLILDLRRHGIINTELLSAFERVPREEFVPEAFIDQSYEDTALPIGYGQTVSQPSVVARMLQALGVEPKHKVLEIGMGSGYQTALLTHLCRRVYAIERHRELHKEAVKRLYALGRNNFTSMAGDGSLGWDAQAPFARIISAASSEKVPSKLIEQLDEGGILVLPIGGERAEQKIVRVVRNSGKFEAEDLGDARFVPLVEGIYQN